MTLKTNKIGLLFFLVLGTVLSGCGVYSFSGTSISPDIKTLSISTFPNNYGQGPSFLSQSITTSFRDYFQRNTNLQMVPRDGDLQMEGQIIGYDFTPVAPQVQDGIDVASLNRLTIRIQVKFTNTKDPKQNFDQAFSGFQDFPQNLNPNQVTESQIRLIVVDRILPEVFNKSVANW